MKLILALLAAVVMAPKKPAPVKKPVPVVKKVAPLAKKAPPPQPAPPSPDETPSPPDGDPDRERILRLQEALTNIVHGGVMGRLHVGMRVMDLSSGRVFYDRRGTQLMDPASNQKVLATATALLRLGGNYRFRTELGGATPDADGAISGDVVLRGSGDPSLRGADLDQMAGSLAARGVTRIGGGVLADPRRIGSDEAIPGERSPLRVSGQAIEVRVRPGDKDGGKPSISWRPVSDAIIVNNRATTRGRGRSRLTVGISLAGGKIHIDVSGRIPRRHPGVVLRRLPPSSALYAALLLRSSLLQAGIEVRGGAGVFVPGKNAEPRRTAALSSGLDVPVEFRPPRTSLAVHESAPLPVLMRRINKDSDNEWAERILETTGAEVYGGSATPAKGVRALREALTELGLPAKAYIPANGSGLGHVNRITPDAMADLLRILFLDPRLGPDMVQSLSVGGVDGTTRNRFRGSPAAERVRAKTGTLNGKSCLSGYVGDGGDILVFSIMVQGMRSRALTSVRNAQVSAVNAMMRYARGAVGPAPAEEVAPGVDLEAGTDPAEKDTDEPADSDGAPATDTREATPARAAPPEGN